MAILLGIALPTALVAQETDCAKLSDATALRAIGQYSDMRFTEEHAYGHTVQLWRAGGCLVGRFQVAEGLAGDTPTGELRNVQGRPGTDELSFTAEVTVGVTQDPTSRAWLPSRDRFEFTGHLNDNVLKGRLLRSDRLGSNRGMVVSNVILTRSLPEEVIMIEARTYGEWRRQIEAHPRH